MRDSRDYKYILNYYGILELYKGATEYFYSGNFYKTMLETIENAVWLIANYSRVLTFEQDMSVLTRHIKWKGWYVKNEYY